MAETKQKIALWASNAGGADHHDRVEVQVYDPDALVDEEVWGMVYVEIAENNVVITVEREDESKFGPGSLVVV